MYVVMNTRSTTSAVRDEAELPSRIAANVRSLRCVRHLTQAELARRVGIRAGPMNAIEKGCHVPTGRVLYRLANVLGVSVDAILGREPASGPSQPPQYVAEAGAAAGGSRWPAAVAVRLSDDPKLGPAAREVLDGVVQSFLALEDLCGAQKRAHIPLYLPFVASEAGIEALVQQVRQLLGVGQAVIFDYQELLENAGLRVVFCPLPDPHQSAAFYDDANANAFLVVHAELNVERQLFELLKRLGAVYLHTRRLCRAAGGPADTLDDLHAARKFAALFLMPSTAVRASVAQLGLAPEDWSFELLLRMKHRFGVSAQAYLLRLQELGLIEDRAARQIKVRIASHYAKTSHAEPDATRRILTPNGRLGDLLLAALQKPETRDAALPIARAMGAQIPDLRFRT